MFLYSKLFANDLVHTTKDITKKYLFPLVMLVIFETVAVSLFLAKGNIFYLFNFSYIGVCLAVGLAMFSSGVKYARHFTQLAIGSYMLVYLGFVCKENMQIEGFWYYIRLGVFEAAVIHYAVAKIFGPLLFGRGWCGYACWTAMIFDLLPYKRHNAPRKKIGFIRLITFSLALAIVAYLFASSTKRLDDVMFYLFICGNALYYAAGIIMAFAFKVTSAFCKYVCPVSALH